MATKQAKYAIGQIVQHRLFDYRGVIYEVDPEFMLTEEWYEQVARSRPPKDQPWYHVLVDQGQQSTYVAERNLAPADNLAPIQHADLDLYFSGYADGLYQTRQRRM